ncbi:MAG: riboflavin synthase [Candidatus Sericytochromatia bacterium]|nr:riboflavin synthase [Candidatus Sericytochromatia bacterium]
MFTGLIEAIGRVVQRQDGRFLFAAPFAAELEAGDSVAVSGACLTVVALEEEGFWADVSATTLAMTHMGAWEVGRAVNLERALALGDRLGGHLVSGHVEGLAVLSKVVALPEGAWRLAFEVGREHAALMLPQGSVAVDGVSLTLNEVGPESFTVTIIPETWVRTTLSALHPGDRVHLENDMLARHVHRCLQPWLERLPALGGA